MQLQLTLNTAAVLGPGVDVRRPAVLHSKDGLVPTSPGVSAELQEALFLPPTEL